MPRRVQIENHLSTDELEQRYRQSSRPTEKSNWHVIWLIARGKKTEEISDFLGISAHWVRQIILKYNRQGPQAMEDQRKNNKGGNPPLLNEQQVQELKEVLKSPPPDGGLWSGPKVAKWMSRKIGREVNRHRAWEYLKKNGL